MAFDRTTTRRLIATDTQAFLHDPDIDEVSRHIRQTKLFCREGLIIDNAGTTHHGSAVQGKSRSIEQETEPWIRL